MTSDRPGDVDLDAVVDAFRADPAGSAVCTDFDGTLAAVVVRPADAEPVAGAVEVLDDLAVRYGLVAVISGRPLAFLDALLPGPFALSGLYGLEHRFDGVKGEHAEASRWRAVVAEVLERAEAEAPEGALIEPKGLSLTVHYRQHPEIRERLEEWAAARARESGLVVRAAKQSVELHPPIEADKGTVIADLAAGYRQVCFLGDDLGDVPAFGALDRLAASGATVLKVAVTSAETAPEVLAATDVAVDGPEAAVDLLRRLV